MSVLGGGGVSWGSFSIIFSIEVSSIQLGGDAAAMLVAWNSRRHICLEAVESDHFISKRVCCCAHIALLLPSLRLSSHFQKEAFQWLLFLQHVAK